MCLCALYSFIVFHSVLSIIFPFTTSAGRLALFNIHSPNISVDLANVHSNILLIHMVNPKVTADEFAKRLGTVTAQELADGVITSAENGASGIVLKVSARDWAYARIVLYHQITDKDVEYTIKKFEYVVKEFDRQLA